jgi:hypothetical protein
MRLFLFPYTPHMGWVNLGAFRPHTGWVKLGAFLLHTGWVNRSAFLPHTGWSTAGRRPPHPSEFSAPDPRKEKQVQLHPPPEEPLKMMDLCNHTYQMIKGLRWVPEKHWWYKTKDKQVEPRFRNVLQQTFYYNYKYLPMKLYQHRVTNWDHMTLATGGDVKAYFDDHPRLADLVSMHHMYVKDWVRVFYATVYIADTRTYIMFMFQGRQYTLF